MVETILPTPAWRCSQKLGKLKAAQQGGQDPFQVPQLVECSPRQLSWFLLLGSWSESQSLCSFSPVRVLCEAQFVFPLRGSKLSAFFNLLWQSGTECI